MSVSLINESGASRTLRRAEQGLATGVHRQRDGRQISRVLSIAMHAKGQMRRSHLHHRHVDVEGHGKGVRGH